jgi:hypothetical protein
MFGTLPSLIQGQILLSHLTSDVLDNSAVDFGR